MGQYHCRSTGGWSRPQHLAWKCAPACFELRPSDRRAEPMRRHFSHPGVCNLSRGIAADSTSAALRWADGTDMDRSVSVAFPGPAPAAILHSGVKNLLRCDAGDVVAGIVSFVLTQRRSLRLAAAVLMRAHATLVARAIMLLNGMRCFAGV